MRKVCSLELAQLMIEQKEPLMVSEIIRLITKRYPHVLIDSKHISGIIRNFASSPFSTCVVYKDSYPHRYQLLSLNGYTFKIRDDEGLVREKFSLYVKAGTPRIAREYQAKEEIRLSKLASDAFRIMSSSVRGRHSAVMSM